MKVQNSASVFPTWDLAKELGIPRESDFEDEQDLITGLPKDWGKQILLEGMSKLSQNLQNELLTVNIGTSLVV